MNKVCDLCGHSLENNPHGFDQNDAHMEGEELIHHGRCTYCRVCNPRIFDKIEDETPVVSIPSFIDVAMTSIPDSTPDPTPSPDPTPDFGGFDGGTSGGGGAGGDF